ncbi:unnamed protein product [Rotaria socialis]|uniref:Uncharacterized protein n=1 Tax=Rotaria socialis TaxID=392032 RepID=A0A821MMZ5_9BILA|nr:unnamed protein product [Rotaria socialis]CAF4772792.1 unnamed protein product [Rotaria socialis]
MKYFIIVLIVSINVTCGLLLSADDLESKWDSFKVTWGPNSFDPEYFVKQPRTIAEAKQNNYQQISDQCEGNFLGQRFMKLNDYGAILIYDNQGTIAGVQMGIPVSMITDKFYQYFTQKMFNRDTIAGVDLYILTAYFVDPRTICQSGRNPSHLNRDGTGTGLWLQNGSNPIRDSIEMPLYDNTVSNTKWAKGACLPTMGYHYWYDNRLDKSCDEFFPAFLLYNKNKLAGFGWIVIGKFEFTKRTEFPPITALTSLQEPFPICIKKRFEEAGGVTAMHHFFNNQTWNILC